MSKPTAGEIEQRFRYHAPSERARELHELVTARTTALAQELTAALPESRGLSLALTKLEKCRMWANQAIATSHEKL